jgi:site-specific DNA recombinase
LADEPPLPMLISMNSAIIYSRVSTTQQEADGVSLQAQASKGRQYAEQHGLKVIGEYQDVASGSKDERPGLIAAMDHACFHPSKPLVICYSLSRLSRSLTSSIRLIQRLSKCGCKFVSLTDGEFDLSNPQSEFMFNIYCSVNELERKITGQRTAMALKSLREQGFNTYSHTKMAYGFDLDPEDPTRVVVNEQEQQVVAQVYAWRDQNLSLGSIVKRLQAMGLRTKTGKEWKRGTVWALLRRVDLQAA